MNDIDKIRLIEKVEGLTREELANKVGMKYTRLRNLVGGQGNLSMEEMRKIGGVFPEYKMWLAYGEEIEEVGQISPMTKAES